MLKTVAKFKNSDEQTLEEDDKALQLKQMNLKEIHKVLSRWNKSNVKSF